MTQLRPDLRAMSPNSAGNGGKKPVSPGAVLLIALLILTTGPFGIVLAVVAGLIYYANTQHKKKQAENQNRAFQSYDEYVEHTEPHDCGDCSEHVMDRLESDEHPDLLDTLTDLVDRVKEGRNEDAEPERFRSGQVYDAPLDQSRYASAPGHTKKERLEQLETLRKAGLFTDEEYRTRKARIMKEP